MVEPQLKRNLGVVIIKDGADKAVHYAINKIYEERVGFKFKVITHTTTSDRAAKVIAMIFNQDEDVCAMYDCDKN